MGRDRAEIAATVALAEFTALRDEIGRRSTSQQAQLGLALTVSTSVFGVVLAGKASVHLLLALPFATGPLAMLFIDNHWTICHLGRYIGNDLRAVLTHVASVSDARLDERLFAWEVHVEEERTSIPGLWWKGSMVGMLVGPGFVAAGAWCVALFATRHVPDARLDFAWRLPALAALFVALWLNASAVQRWRNDPTKPRPRQWRARGAASRTVAAVGAAALAVAVTVAALRDPGIRTWGWAWGRPIAGAVALVLAPLGARSLWRRVRSAA